MNRKPKKPRPKKYGCQVYRDMCPEHGYIHGQEAEELRQGVEKIIASLQPEMGDDDSGIADDLRKLMDEVDARDSLAHLDAQQIDYEGMNVFEVIDEHRDFYKARIGRCGMADAIKVLDRLEENLKGKTLNHQ